MSVTIKNLTVYAIIEKEICIENIYELIVLETVPGYIFIPSKTIGFFGTEGIFIGAKSEKWGSRGIRCQTENGEFSGAMRNCVSVDYQYNVKNNNVKVFKNLLHIGAQKSFESGAALAQSMMDIFTEIARIWQPFFDLSVKDRLDFFESVVLPMVTDKNNELMKIDDSELFTRFSEEKDSLGEFADVVRLSISFIDHYKTYDAYVEKLKKVAFLVQHGDDIFSMSGKLEITEIINGDGIYTGKIPHTKLIPECIVKHLLSLDIDASHFNCKEKYIKVITYTGLENYIPRKTNSKTPAHQISIGNDGVIRVNSPGLPEVVVSETERILKIVCDFIESPAYPQVNMNNVGARIKFLSHKLNTIEDIMKLSPSGITDILEEEEIL